MTKNSEVTTVILNHVTVPKLIVVENNADRVVSDIFLNKI